MTKGFTLIELLAVIVILSIIVLIAIVIVEPSIISSKKKLLKLQKNNLEEVAETYYLKEGIKIGATCVNVQELIDRGYIEASEIINPKTKKAMTGSIKISKVSNQYKYEYINSECSE